MLKAVVGASIGLHRARRIKRASVSGIAIFSSLARSIAHKAVANAVNRARYAHRQVRRLEIGPGTDILEEFETVDVLSRFNVTYVADASQRLPFADATFDLVYASHIIEHVPWYQVHDALSEWVRVLKPGGVLEVWTPNGLKIAKAFVDAEEKGASDFHGDGWWRFNQNKDPCTWAAGRCFSYGDGTGATTRTGIAHFSRHAI